MQRGVGGGVIYNDFLYNKSFILGESNISPLCLGIWAAGNDWFYSITE